MPKKKATVEPKLKTTRAKKFEQPVLPPGEQKEARYNGPWHAITADALVSKTYTGRVDLGRYTEPEKRSGKLDRRLQSLAQQGYKNVAVREIPAE
jgi:hypothetical protein